MPFRKTTQQDQQTTFQPGFGVQENDPIYLGVKSNLEHIQHGRPLDIEKDQDEYDFDDDEDDFSV